MPASKRYRTHDGTCNNAKRPRWGAANMPFHRFLSPDYADGIEEIRGSVMGGPLPSARFVSLVVHGYRDEEAPVTMMLPIFGQLVDHDLTATMQPRSINGSVPTCCDAGNDLHPSCLPIKVPRDDPWLSPLGVRCLEFLRSAPAQRRDCLLSWREQTNQVTSYLDASSIYSSSPRQSDNSRILREGLLLFGRGPARDDPCANGGFGHQCIKSGDNRASEQPGLLAIHTVFVSEHNKIALELSDMNPHWSDEKLFQETRRIVSAMLQHITYREFLPLVLGKEVCRLFGIELEKRGFYDGYDHKVNPSISNSFSAAAFRFGHSLIQGTMVRSDPNHRFIPNNVSLHEENSRGDIGSHGSLHRIIRGLVNQRALKRDEFMSPELTNHLFQSGSFPFGMDLAAINIQRGRDHGIPSYTAWRQPCGLSPINDWSDMIDVVGPRSTERIRRAYRHVDDIDLFVGGIAERPVVGGLIGPTFSCIIAQQFSNLRRGDRFWYENPDLMSSFTPFQLESIRQVSLAQILCRALGGGTLQPHVFLPPDNDRNARQPCGFGDMAPIDLTPWLERDPFIAVDGFDNGDSFETDSSESPIHRTESNLIDRVDFFLGKPDEHSDKFQPLPDHLEPASDRLGDSDDSPFNSDQSSTFQTANSQDHVFHEPTQHKIDLPGQQTRPKKPNKQTVPVRPNFNPAKIQVQSEPLDSKLDFSGKVTQKTTLKRQPPTSTKPTRVSTTTTKKSIIKPVQPNKPIQPNKKRPQTTVRRLKATSKKPNSRVTPVNFAIGTTKRQNQNNNRNKNKNKKKGQVVEVRSNDDSDSDSEESTDNDNDSKNGPNFFVNQDNATKYLFNLPIRPDQVIGSNLKIESRVNYGGSSYAYDSDYDYYENQNPYKPPYVQSQKPYRQTTLPPSPPARPLMYQNNQPAYRPDQYGQDYGYRPIPPQYQEPSYIPNRRPTTTKFPTPISSPISNRNSTPFSYDTYNPGFLSIDSQINYDHIKQNPPNRVYRPTNPYRPSPAAYHTSTRRPELQTFMIVETTKRTTQIPYYFDNTKRTTKKTPYSNKIDNVYYPAFTSTTKKPNRYNQQQYPGAFSGTQLHSHNYDPLDYDEFAVKRQTNITTTYFFTRASTRRPFRTRPTKIDKYPYAERPTKEQLNQFLQIDNHNQKYDSDSDSGFNPYAHVENDDYVESDEIIRPEYQRPHKISYHDYTKYNVRPNNDPNRVKYYYKGNVLYKYNGKQGLFDSKEQIRRYADFYDLPFDEDEEKDNYVKHLIEEYENKIREQTNETDVEETESKIKISDKLDLLKTDEKLEGRSRTDDIFIVPLQVLTRPERPDDWLVYEAPDNSTKLPDVPTLKQDANSSSKELPKPIFPGKKRLNKPTLTET